MGTCHRFAPLAAALLLLACSGCSKPQPPDKDQPPEPQAQGASRLSDAIQRPIERARAVEPEVLDAADRQKAAIDAQAGG